MERMGLGIVGAGTMGAGIAQVAAAGGMDVLLHDGAPGAAARGLDRAREGLARWAAKGRCDAQAAERLAIAEDLKSLAGCDLVIEAVVEDATVKRELLAALAEAAPRAVLATNTSSIPVTTLAAGLPDPGRLVGLHFFNPVPLMGLVEVVAGLQSSPGSLTVARAAGAAMGKRVVDAADGPGFLVNRCSRPFGLEAQALLASGIADVPTIDRIVRAAGFRMGPFELADLVGLDVGLTAAESFFTASYGEPRWRPSPLVAQLVAAGRLGRKTGRGWFAYDADGRPTDRPDDAEAPPLGGGDGRVLVIAGELNVADDLRALADAAGFDVRDAPDGDVPWLIVDAGHDAGEGGPLQGAPQALLVADASLHQLDPGGASVGFHAIGPLEPGRLVECTRGPGTAPVAAERLEALCAACGLTTAWVADTPGLVLGRIVAQLVNEAAFALDAGVTDDPEALDDGMVLGLNHPRGPLAWGDEVGLDHVVAILDGLRAELGEERYRASPRLRRMVGEGRLGLATGAGFHRYDEDDLTDPPR